MFGTHLLRRRHYYHHDGHGRPPHSTTYTLSLPSIVYFPPSTWSPFFRPSKRLEAPQPSSAEVHACRVLGIISSLLINHFQIWSVGQTPVSRLIPVRQHTDWDFRHSSSLAPSSSAAAAAAAPSMHPSRFTVPCTRRAPPPKPVARLLARRGWCL